MKHIMSKRRDLRNEKGQFVKGNSGFWLGRKRPGLITKTSFKKGQIAHNLGKRTGVSLICPKCKKEFYVIKTKLTGRVQFCSKTCQRIDNTCIDCGVSIQHVSKRCRSCANTGKLHPSWRGGLRGLNRIIYQSAQYKRWRNAIFERDNYTCQDCNQRGGILQADHIKSFSQYPELRFNLSNGRALCVQCHKKTPNYGYKAILVERGDANELQFI